ESAAFKRFNPAFVSLVGRANELSAPDMQAFTDFILTVTYPPNPVRALDNQLTDSQAIGQGIYLNNNLVTDGVRSCNGCHHLDPTAGFFGTDGQSSFQNETQLFKIPHLRNAYAKVGMFGFPDVPFVKPGDNGAKNEQVRGFGYLHDGSIDTLSRFLSATVFNLFGSQISGMEDFLLAFDSNLAPIVGQQVTRSAASTRAVDKRIALLIERAAAGECDLVVKGNLGGQSRGWWRIAGGQFRSDRASEPLLGTAELRKQSKVAGQERTFTCVP